MPTSPAMESRKLRSKPPSQLGFTEYGRKSQPARHRQLVVNCTTPNRFNCCRTYARGPSMDRRHFLASAASGASFALLSGLSPSGEIDDNDRVFASPDEAGKSPPERLGYVIGVY